MSHVGNYTCLAALTWVVRSCFLKIVFVFHDVTMSDQIFTSCSRVQKKARSSSANRSILPSSRSPRLPHESQVIRHKRRVFLTVVTLCLHNSWMLKCLNNLSPRPAGVSYDVPDSGIIKGRDVVVKSPPELHYSIYCEDE